MNELDEIKNKLDIVDFIGQYQQLKKAGRNYRGLCPFHSEKTPSMMVSPDKQIWHCFGCGAGGDVFGFLMKKEGFSFSEALNQLAEQAGVELKNRPTNFGEKNRLLAVNELAAKFYERALVDSKAGRQATNYLIDRGISKEIIKTFRLGYAPAGWEYAIKFLQRKSYTLSEIEKAGIAVGRNGRFSDKFRHRLMFPITNTIGKVVGFTGRVLRAGDQPKYLNSPETLVFNKGSILYGLSITKEEIQTKNTAILVEGQTDLISSYQAGVKNVVASSGTALTSDQLRLIRRYAEVLVLALDADSAGREAVKRATALASAEDLEIKVAILGEYKDPDECIKKAGDDKWKEVITNAIPIIDFYINTAISKYGKGSITAKKKIAMEVLPIISGLENPVEKDQYISKLAGAAGISQSSLYEVLNKPKSKYTKTKSAAPDEVALVKDSSWLERRILGLLIYLPKHFADHQVDLEGVNWPTDFLAQVYANLKICYTDEDFLLDKLTASLEYQHKVDLLETMMVIEEHYANMQEEEIGKELNFYITLLRQRATKLQLLRLSREIAEAEKAGDNTKLQSLLERFQKFK
ncbi:DNA primase [Patescibacteria group bacterium]|nr:DNA primase [Patescibacteria group bacterium]